MTKTILILFLGLASSFGAAADARAGEGTLALLGTPGARLRVDGEERGTLPVGEMRLSEGRHEIRLDRPGFESQTEAIWIHEVRGLTRAIYLRAKTRDDAMRRALVVPGWGIAYNGSPKRGAVYFVLDAACLGYALHQNGVFLDRKDTYEAADDVYRRAVGAEEIVATRAERDAAYDRMADSESNRDKALVAAGIVYGLSLIHTYFFFPFGDLDIPDHVAIAPAAGGADGVSVALRFPF